MILMFNCIANYLQRVVKTEDDDWKYINNAYKMWNQIKERWKLKYLLAVKKKYERYNFIKARENRKGSKFSSSK